MKPDAELRRMMAQARERAAQARLDELGCAVVLGEATMDDFAAASREWLATLPPCEP